MHDDSAQRAVRAAGLGRWWRGEERLVIVYWISLGIFIAVGAMGLVTPYLDAASVRLLWIVQCTVAGFCLVSIWACAFNVKRRVWGYLARVHAGIGAIGLLGNVVNVLRG